MEKERKLQILDLSIVIGLVVAGCVIGKLVMEKYDTWISFNGPAIGVLVIGELVWWRIRKRLMSKRNGETK